MLNTANTEKENTNTATVGPSVGLTKPEASDTNSGITREKLGPGMHAAYWIKHANLPHNIITIDTIIIAKSKSWPRHQIGKERESQGRHQG